MQELVPVRHARMAVTAFTFYRGAALVMAADLASMPRSGLDVQLCGDAHLSNFGLFAAPDRSVIFDVNDFDETNPGPFEWDVKRLATSFVLAARDNGLSGKVGRAAAEAAAALLPPVHGRLRREAGDRDLVRPHRRRPAGRGGAGVCPAARARPRPRRTRKLRRPSRGPRRRLDCATPGRRSRRSPKSWTDSDASATSRRC